MSYKVEQLEKGERESKEVVGALHLALMKLSGLVSFEGSSFYFIPTIVTFLYVQSSHLIVSSMYLCGTISMLMKNTDRLNVQAIAETVGLCGLHARYILMSIKRGKIAHILDESKNLSQELNTGEKALIKKFVAKSSRLAKFYVLVNCAMGIFYLSASQLPLFDMSNAENFNRSLPYIFYSEVDEKSAYFAASVTIQMLAMIGACFSTWGVDTSAPFFIMITCGHFRILCTKLKVLQQSTTQISEADIIKCVTYHQNIIAEHYSYFLTSDKIPQSNQIAKSIISISVMLIFCALDYAICSRFCQEIEQLLSPVFLVQLMSSTYNIALIGLKLVDDDPDKIKYASVFLILIFQLFVCQWAPDLLVTESSALLKSTYFIPESIDYYNPKTIRLMHMFSIRAQNAVHLKAGGYVNLSMESFGSLIKGIVSFFTVIRSFS